MKLPERWRPAWPEDDEAPPGPDAGPGAPRLSLREAQHGELESFGVGFLEEGWAAWGLERAPDGDCVVELDRFPDLDEMVCLYLWVRAEEPDAPSTDARRALAQYGADVRQGFWPDRVEPEQAIQSIYQAILHRHLVEPEAPRRARFLAEALSLVEHVTSRVDAGDSLLEASHFTDAPAYERYVALLRADRSLYREDLARGARYGATLPGRCSSHGAERQSALISLRKPTSAQFKLWARSDPSAPGGEGYPLMLVEIHDREPVLSADPVKRIKIGWLAAILTEHETTAANAADDGASEEAWYDGSRHEGTLVAAPRGGSQLSSEEVIEILQEQLALVPLADGDGAEPVATEADADADQDGSATGASAAPAEAAGVLARRPWLIAAALAAGLAVWFGVQRLSQPPAEPVAALSTAAAGGDTKPPLQSGDASKAGSAEFDPAPNAEPADPDDRIAGAKGEPLTAKSVAEVVATHESGGRAQYALLAGVCSYRGERRLRSPCRDASALRKTLIKRYGYRAENIIFLVDEAPSGVKPDGKPTAENMKRHIERFRKRYGDDEDSSFLFYYSGHGGYVDGAHDDYGVLQPRGFFTKYKKRPMDHRGWDMQQLLRDIKKGVPSKHIMAIIDACYSGWTGAKGDDDAFDDKVRSLWRSRAEVILSAASKGQRAWEDETSERSWAWKGHSALTAFLLRGLSVNKKGLARADRNRDGIVTDEEIGRYVRKEVPSSVASNKNGSRQTPRFFRLDRSLLQSGQFLFVPRHES